MLKQGSEWRRWDLHVHTPDTALNNQFQNWDEYLAAIEGHPDVKVIGVTDYLSIANYSKLKRFKSDGRIANVELLIPNIEFRIAPPTDKATAVNIHLLFSPDAPDHEQQILNALGRLSWTYGPNKYSCLSEQLMDLGRAFDPSIRDDRAALTMGVTQFKVDFTTLRSWYNKEPWINQNALVAVAAGKDGLSGFYNDGAWAALREEITRFAHILFSGREGEREFWLGQGSRKDQETIRRLGGPKPCVHGSDAHSIAKLFNPDQSRYCWIKADPTFEGLRQILYEPDDRVHIGPTPPIFHDQARVIRSIRISNAGGWFDEVEIPLNRGLVSIIGQKGSGKSALAELVAYGTGSWKTGDPESFLIRAGDHLQGLTLQLCWADEAVSSVRLFEDQPEESRVRYLSQKFVERLCAEDSDGAELIREIESVIFSHLDPVNTLFASNFEELRAMQTQGIREEGNRIRAQIAALIREESALRTNVGKLDIKRARIKTLNEERAGLQKQTPLVASPDEAKVQVQLLAHREALSRIQRMVALDKQNLQRLADIKLRVTNFREQMTRFYEDIRVRLKETDVPEDEIAGFQPRFSGDTEAPLIRRSAAIQEAIGTKTGHSENPAEGTILRLQHLIRELEAQQSADKARQEKIRAVQTRIATIDTEIERLNLEITHIEGPEKERLLAVKRERMEAYVAFFRSLRREQDTLEELYAPVSQRLQSDEASPHERDLDLSIRWLADLDGWMERGSVLFDQRKTIPYGTVQGLADAARRILVPAWTSGNPALVEPAMAQFLEGFRKDELRPAEKYLRSGITAMDVLQWLYEVDHIRLSYGLKYNGVDLENLSPGTKGIVLLILYLGMDVSDTRPLIVDQPDENLDNESIYRLLTGYFKLAKRHRQIILITHNPNLVVNADSEQVIVARCERRESGLPHIAYNSGALEDAGSREEGIRRQVCRILEGGSDAFLRREKRYALVQG